MRPRQSHEQGNEAQTNYFARPLIVKTNLYEQANSAVGKTVVIGQVGAVMR
jgi:hypothetical protein